MFRPLAILAFLIVLPASAAHYATGEKERPYFAWRTDNGVILSEAKEGDDCIDVVGRTRRLETAIPADGGRHRVFARVDKGENMRVHPPTYSSIDGSIGISSSAYVIVHGRQRFLECSTDTIYVLRSVKRLPEQ